MKTIALLFRKLKKSSTATSLGIMGLIVGLVCVLFIFFWVNNEISYNRFNKKIDRIFAVHAYLEGGDKKIDFGGCPPAVGPSLTAEYPEVESSCRYIPPYQESLVSYGNKKNNQKVALADFSLFDIFTLPFVYGNTGEKGVPNQIVLTETMAKSYFGVANPVGKSMKYGNQKDLTVVGVIQDIPSNSSINFDAVIPIENMKWLYDWKNVLGTWYNNAFRTYGLLNTPESFDKIASSITNRIQKEIPESTNYLRAYKFEDKYLYEQKNIVSVRIFGLVGLLVLVAAILNFINLITARMGKQAKDTGVRKSLGASRLQIVRIIYLDVALICLIAFGVAFLVASLGLPIFSNFINNDIAFASLFKPLPMATLVVLYLLTVLLAGLYPAAYLSSFSPVNTLKSNFTSVKKGSIFRNSLVVSIFVVSIILLSSTFIISRQISLLQKMDIGYNKEQLLYLNLQGQLKEKAQVLKEDLRAIPGVSAATISSNLPITIGNNGEGWNWEGKDENFKPLVTNWEADEDLVNTLGASMAEGSFLKKGQEGIVINKAFADLIGWDSFTGKTINGYGTDYQILGVLNNIQYNTLSEASRPMVIFPVGTNASSYLIARVEPKQVGSILQQASVLAQQLEAAYPFNYGFIDDDFGRLLASEKNLEKLIKVFSIFAIVVLCLGLLGVIMFMAEQKTKEIGIRKCMGEAVSSLIVRFVKPFVISCGIAAAIAIPITWYVMQNWLQDYAYHIQLNVGLFLLSLLAILLIAVITVSFQSWKAATKNPVEALRYE